MSLDLPLRAAAKAKQALDDVLQLADDPRDKIQIALMATNALVGVTAAIIKDVNNKAGSASAANMTQQEAILRLLDLLQDDVERNQTLLDAIENMRNI